MKDTSKRIISQAESSLESDSVNDFDTLELSLFSRLFRKYGSDDVVTIFLNEQYRMHPFIANFASTFYKEPIFSPNMEKRNLREWFNEEFGELFSSKLADLLKETPWRFDLPFIGLDTGEKRWYQDLETLSESAFNLHEARFISSLIIQLFGAIFNFLLDLNGNGQLDEERAFHLLCNLGRGIGVTTPYRTQVMKIKTIFQEQLRSFLNELNLSISDEKIKYIEQSLMIETVDRFQGREKEIMIISLVDSNPEGSISDLLQDDRRLNVAITRAKRKLIVVGNITMLSILPFYQRMRDYLKSIHGLLYV